MTPLVLTLAFMAGAAPARGQAQLHAEDPGTDTLVLTHGTIIPMEGDRLLRDWTLVLAGGEIVEMRPSGTGAVPSGAEVRDLGGSYVLPGLIDAHVHLREPQRSLPLFPATGVTTVVNLEGRPGHLALRDRILSTRMIAPRILSSGPFLEEVAETPEGARREVRRQHESGYDLVKIHGEIEEETFAAAIDEARALGMPVVAHRPGNLPTDRVLDSGIAALAHAEELLSTDLGPDSVAAAAHEIVASGTALITTLGFFTGMRDQATDRFYEMIARPELAYISPERRRAWLYDGHREYIEQGELPWYETAVDVLHRVTGAVHAEGGVVIAGTDTPLEFTVPGFSLHRELERLVAAGLAPLEAIRAATVAPADLLGRTDLGRVAVDGVADLVIVERDPTTSLAALEHPQAVVLRGRWLSREALDESLDRIATAYAKEEVTRAARERILEDVRTLLREEGVEAGAAELKRIDETPGAPKLGEADLNSLGYMLLGSGDVGSAIEIFRFNARAHPESANVHDSLGEAYLTAGRLEEAEVEYLRALELDPSMDSSRRGLREIADRRGGRR